MRLGIGIAIPRLLIDLTSNAVKSFSNCQTFDERLQIGRRELSAIFHIREPTADSTSCREAGL
jgi:hypothetical protein